jgi:signal peptidase I
MSAMEKENKIDSKEIKPEQEIETPQRNETRELITAIIVAGVIALLVRTFAFEPFNIPSGSMLPTLQIGDYLFVSKASYGYSKYSFPFNVVNFDGRVASSSPKRGDIAVFRKPKQTSIDYIKRIIGLPGDEIQMIGGILHINGKAVMRELVGVTEITSNGHFAVYNEYIETLPNGVRHSIYEISDFEQYDDTEIYKVPNGYYFAMGDNRDSSLDSRVFSQVGFVPAENLIGRAVLFFFSIEGMEDKCDKPKGALRLPREILCKIITIPQMIRYNRILHVI